MPPRRAGSAHPAAPSNGRVRRLAVARRFAAPPSALVVPVPEADVLVAAHRMLHDPAAALGMPAHVTVLFPFLPARHVGPEVEAALRRTLAGSPAFAFRLARTGRFPAVLYLAPEPADRFVALTDAVRERWPAYQPYDGRHAVVVPHLSVAHDAWPAGLASELERGLPIEAEAREVCLLTQARSGRWSTRLRIPLSTTNVAEVSDASDGSDGAWSA